jgi:hypothetical protein
MYRCALVSPEKGQCVRSLYHATDHEFSPELPWTETVEELRAQIVPRLALEFSRALVVEIGVVHVRLARMRNRIETSTGVCHTHDFCDANMAMAVAFERFGLKTFVDYEHADDGSLSVEEIEATDLWNAAWDYARDRGFFLDELKETAHG